MHCRMQAQVAQVTSSDKYKVHVSKKNDIKIKSFVKKLINLFCKKIKETQKYKPQPKIYQKV